MSRCDEEPRSGERGRGTEILPNRILVGIKSREEEKLLIRGERETALISVPRPLLDIGGEYPPLPPVRGDGTTAPLVRDKDFVPFDATYRAEGERDWHEQDREQVRYLATSKPARLLSKAVRQAAGRDAGLVWSEATRTYCRRSSLTPHPQEPARGG